MKSVRYIAVAMVIFATAQTLFAKDINLWNKVPSMRGERAIMEIFVPKESNGTGVIICPGGSYHHLGILNEGHTTAKWFNEQGAVAFVLWYRVANNNYHYPAMMQDIQRAIQLVRENAESYKVNPDKLGLIGFSAGGHLVTWAGAFGERTNELEKIGIVTEVSLTPNFVIPVYPVVTMQEDIGHAWSRKSLLGKQPSQEQRDLFSMEMQIPANMPPVYLVACRDDPVVIYENSERLYSALVEKNIPCVFARYDWGGHGFGMTDNKFMQAFHWNEPLRKWLQEQGFLPADNAEIQFEN
ncbi:MAG: alpha/beta hydrolase [Treponema sp.]|nr:alpha/beta hydrolase [Treponema sp.]